MLGTRAGSAGVPACCLLDNDASGDTQSSDAEFCMFCYGSTRLVTTNSLNRTVRKGGLPPPMIVVDS